MASFENREDYYPKFSTFRPMIILVVSDMLLSNWLQGPYNKAQQYHLGKYARLSSG